VETSAFNYIWTAETHGKFYSPYPVILFVQFCFLDADLIFKLGLEFSAHQFTFRFVFFHVHMSRLLVTFLL